MLNSEGERGKSNAMGLRCTALGLLPAMRHVERGRNFKQSEKLIQAYCKTVEKKIETDSQLRRKLFRRGYTYIYFVLGSPPKLKTSLSEWRNESHPAWLPLFFFGASLPSQQRSFLLLAQE